MINLQFPLETLLPITENEAKLLKIIPPKPKNEIAVIFDNFLRDRVSYNLIKSIMTWAPGVKIYIAEQGTFDPAMQILYKRLKEAGHVVINVGFDAGISVSRNSCVTAAQEPYIFMCDCDNIFISETDLLGMVKILKKNLSIGFLSLCERNPQGIVEHYEHFLERHERILHYIDAWPENKNNHDPYFLCDYTHNVGMIRKELFESVRYEETMKLAEHLDFFMQIKYNSSWKVAVSLKQTIKNQNVICDSEIYKSYRGRNKMYWKLYVTKWGLDIINNYTLPTDCISKTNYYVQNPYVNQKPDYDMAKAKIEINESHQSIDLDNHRATLHLKDFSDILDKYNLDYYIVEQTCLNYVRHKSVYSPFYLAIPVLTNEARQDLEKSGFVVKKKISESEILYERNSILIHVGFWKPKLFKLFDKIEGKNFKVPFPVVQYLRKRYGMKWEQLPE